MSIASNLEFIRARIHSACDSSQRNPNSVTLIAVSKNHPISSIREAYEAGQRHFGESRLQEALPKIESMPSDIVWHFIGTLQSNKAKKIATVFNVVHTFYNREQILEAEKAARPVECLIEVNIADEPQKAGISQQHLDEYHQFILQSRHVHFRGLMTIGPEVSKSEEIRSYFRELNRLGDQVGADWLSMGMSGDFEVAIQEGASHIRVGTAVFGPRKI